jgi:2-polyprenyl-6-methoxyphenol hydroxylase-like FAD-dependent oxidoreductase
MAEVLVLGAGLNGLTTAMLLAGDGHGVTVVERDPTGPPSDIDEAWAGWERRGVNQFRMGHLMLPRWTSEVRAALPQVIEELESAGGLRINILHSLPEAFTGGRRDGDDRFETVTARRPVLEAAVAAAAARTPGITVRRGVAVTGVRTGAEVVTGAPHVTGVLLEGGGVLHADLVIDACGRRSPMPAWLEAAGGRRPREEREDSGFVYYQRHFRSTTGELPESIAGMVQHYASLSVITLPADRGTWAVVLVASGRDAELRALRDSGAWARAIAQYPFVAHWATGEPLEDRVVTMAAIEDRHRRYVVGDEPVATGVVAVGDAWACTNPSLGRGTSIGVLHALSLRDVLRQVEPSEPEKLVRVFDDVTNREVEPLYRATLAFDRHRLAEVHADIAGRPYQPNDPSWIMTKSLASIAPTDPDVLRAYASIGTLQATPQEALTAPGVFAQVAAAAASAPQYPLPGPDRSELLAAVAG